MKVRILVGAQAAYACIDAGTITMDVRLEAGRSPAQSLREFAAEQQEKAARLVRRAALAREAAFILEQDKVAA
jgi:hypothetical protein